MANLNSPRTPGFALRDYHHAAKTFTQEPGYTKTPYTGFNFHVNISFNNLLGRLRGIETKDISVLVKAADLPETQFETETLNQYNRKRIINKRVVYQPINLEFHDDIANNIRNMWIAYNQHYNADSNYTLNSTWGIDDVYANYTLNRKYGLDNGNSSPFINKIEIFSMGNNEYSKMLLVNPVINSAKFDDHEYSDNAKVMSLTLTIEYENIIYSAGTTDQISNFGKDNNSYDQNDSTIESINLNSRTSNVSLRQNSGLANDVLENGQNSVPDTVVSALQTNNSSDSTNAIDPDAVTGNLSKSFSADSAVDYQTSKSAIQNSRDSGNQYVFPDASDVDITELSTLDQLRQQSLRSSSVSSNNSNISGNLQNNLPDVELSGTSNTPEIIINPIIPDNLSPAEQQLFVLSYPPLSSTDKRSTKPPYV